jgi:hypothetical protein
MMELSFFRYRKHRFTFIYFNWGKYFLEKRIVFEIYVAIKKKVRGISIGWSNEPRRFWFKI